MKVLIKEGGILLLVIITMELKIVILPYFENMAYLYHLADKVVCRAGASSISELLHYQKDAFLIPYPYAGNHQEDNAKAFVRLGMGEYNNQESVTFNMLKQFFMHQGKSTFKK